MILIERLIENYKKIALGFGAATAICGIVFSWFDKLDVPQKISVSVIAYVVCAAGALLWARYSDTWFVRKRVTTDKVDKSALVIKPEETLALEANKAARRYFGMRRTIKFNEYRKWREKNPYIFSAIVNDDRDLLGFFDVFPLKDEIGRRVLKGELSENDLTIDDFYSEASKQKSAYIYVATVMSCVVNDHFEARLIDHISEFVMSTYPPTEGRIYLAFSATTTGGNLLKRNKFIKAVPKELTPCGRDLWVLNADNIDAALSRVKTTTKAIAVKRVTRKMA